MTAIKPRHPLTFAAGVTRIMGALGVEACGAAIGKSPSLVYKLADPDGDHAPTIDQALLLDRAWLLAGQPSPPPLHHVYGERLAVTALLRVVDVERISPFVRLAAVIKEAGDVAGALQGARADGRVSRTERLAILTEIDDAVLALQRLARDLDGMAA